jgi:hypothetical protein
MKAMTREARAMLSKAQGLFEVKIGIEAIPRLFVSDHKNICPSDREYMNACGTESYTR